MLSILVIFPVKVALGYLSDSTYFSLKCSCINAFSKRKVFISIDAATSPEAASRIQSAWSVWATIFSSGAFEKNDTRPARSIYLTCADTSFIPQRIRMERRILSIIFYNIAVSQNYVEEPTRANSPYRKHIILTKSIAHAVLISLKGTIYPAH